MDVALAFSLSVLEVFEPVHELVDVWYLQQLASGANLSVWDYGIALPALSRPEISSSACRR
jgi:hypothetical protein